MLVQLLVDKGLEVLRALLCECPEPAPRQTIFTASPLASAYPRGLHLVDDED